MASYDRDIYASLAAEKVDLDASIEEYSESVRENAAPNATGFRLDFRGKLQCIKCNSGYVMVRQRRLTMREIDCECICGNLFADIENVIQLDQDTTAGAFALIMAVRNINPIQAIA